eukprot:14781100-Alexandrium_andersonii.AAC.1
MSASLVGSEMCIRDSPASSELSRAPQSSPELSRDPRSSPELPRAPQGSPCLLYTSDAADDM